MKLTKLEQSGFIFETNTGFRLALDVGSYTPLESLSEVGSVDAFLVSHVHPDHFSAEHIAVLSPKKVFLNQECIDGLGEIKPSYKLMRIRPDMSECITDGLNVTCFEVDHGPNVSVQPEDNMGFLLEIDGQTIYFTGDMFNTSGIDTKELEVDIALLPIGGFYTFGVEEALDFAKTFKSIGTIVPMHYVNNPPAINEFAEKAIDMSFKILEKPTNLL